jgi:UDP-glucose 4-epimerase
MAVLVTGGAGYIGSQMVHELLDAGERAVVLDDLSTGFRWVVPESAHFVLGDSGDQALLTRLFREHDVDTIIHFAACIVVPDSVREVIDTVKRVAGIDFMAEDAPRRQGDPARIVAASKRIRDILDWRPRFDDLSTIVAHALDWEAGSRAGSRVAPLAAASPKLP